MDPFISIIVTTHMMRVSIQHEDQGFERKNSQIISIRNVMTKDGTLGKEMTMYMNETLKKVRYQRDGTPL